MSRRICLVLLLGWSAQAAQAQQTVAASEKDFLSEMPVVLSVSRLPQRLDETPGAVTVLDRNMIRLSGARDVAELLLLVPGFQSSTSFEADAPQVSYHGGFGSYSGRLQVLVDGRSAYSPYLFGSVALGLQSVAIADIERIEVLRGSNSAAYGARAFLGVINIVTRDPVDTLGLRASTAVGENGVRDALASLGWGQDNASFRLSADRRGDDGLKGSNGHNRISRVNFRADLRPSPADELQVRLGSLGVESGVGYAGELGRPEHDRTSNTSYLQLDWRRNLGVDADLAFSYAHSDETYVDNFFYALPAPFNGLVIDFGGRASTDTLSVQHTLRKNANLRFVWGGELRREQVTSRPLYDTDAIQQTDFTRIFGNVEWRATRDVVVNAGGLLEKSSRSGDSFSPRVMVNWHAADGQTLRAGVSKAYRPPSTFETSSNVRYVANGVLLQINSLSRGTVQPESVVARELGYLGEFPGIGVSLDVRAFHEQIGGFIRNARYTLPPGTQLFQALYGISTTNDYVNSEDFAIRGLEYQLKWRPWSGAQLVFNQAWTSIDTREVSDVTAAPKLASTLMWTQKLPSGIDLSLIHHDRGATKLQGTNETFAMSRTDLRLGWPVRFGKQRGDVALVVQNLGASYLDFDRSFQFQQRAFVTLQLENN
jgi:iron complex outermembrane receptor protein